MAYSTRPESALVGFLASSGEFFGYTRSRNTSLIYARPPTSGSASVYTVPKSCVAPTSYNWYYQPVDQSSGRPTNSSQSTDCSYFVPRPSVVQAALNDSSGRPFWTIFTADDGGVLLVSMQAVLLPGFQTPIGVMMTAVSISNDLRWLGKQNLMHGDFFVMDEAGHLLTQTGPPRPRVVAPQQQPRAETSDILVVAETARYLNNRLGNMSALTLQPFAAYKVKINGEQYRIQSIPLDPVCKCLVNLLLCMCLVFQVIEISLKFKVRGCANRIDSHG